MGIIKDFGTWNGKDWIGATVVLIVATSFVGVVIQALTGVPVLGPWGDFLMKSFGGLKDVAAEMLGG